MTESAEPILAWKSERQFSLYLRWETSESDELYAIPRNECPRVIDSFRDHLSEGGNSILLRYSLKRFQWHITLGAAHGVYLIFVCLLLLLLFFFFLSFSVKRLQRHISVGADRGVCFRCYNII